MKRLRFGILATGNIARQFAEGVAGSERCAIVAVASRGAKSASTFAAKHHIVRAYGSYDELIDDADLDAIYIASPNNTHHEWTLRALEAGKHVLCEKPLAVNAQQAEEMFARAEQRERVLVEAFMYRSHPQTHAVLETLKRGAVGNVKAIRTSFCFNIRDWQQNTRFKVELAGGSLMDIGCYCVDFGRLLTGEHPEKITCSGHLHESGIDDYAAGTLVYPSGVINNFTCGMTLQAGNMAEVLGDEGYVEIPVPWKPPVEDALFRVQGQKPPRQQQGGGKQRMEETFNVDADKPLYALEADDFAATVLDGAPPSITAADTLSTMQVLDELRRQVGLPF